VKYLITGGCGFVGSHLADRLIGLGHSVVVIDDLTTGSMQNILHLRENPRFEYVIGSVLNEPLLAECVDQVEGIFHLAAAVGVTIVVEQPIRTITTNIDCTEVVLEHASKKGKKVLFTSTSEVYGKSEKAPYAEDDDLHYGPTTKNRWCYAYSKAVDEFLALAHHRTRGLPVVIVRLFNTVGPRQTGAYGMVVPRFVEQALTGESITIYGTGEQSRCFCHVEDVTAALVRLMESDGAVGEIFNVGSDKEVTILELAEIVRRTTGSRAPTTFIPYEQAYAPGFEDMQRRQPDLSKIRRAIGFEPKHSLEQIVTDVAAYLRVRLGQDSRFPDVDGHANPA
jgi:UDP-glucose 4-epimerase